MRKIPTPIPNNCTGSGPAPKRPGHLLHEQPGESGRKTNDSPDDSPDVNPIPINPDPDDPDPEQFFGKPDGPRSIPPRGAHSGI